ncbi:MAG: tRNA (adenosine(37)-N6)-dimethylallyltransferase MiaA [Patescibacteria group bacterium]
MNKPKIIVIVGPTGSGKTALAVQLARTTGGELVSADSRQVYRGMDIGTGKERFADVPQHLIDIVNPDEDFTLADFLERAKKVIADIHARGGAPIVVGGTGLYVQALVENWQVPNIAPDKKMRAELEKKSVDELRLELAAIDPEEAKRLERGKRYLVRALEMWRTTGQKPSALKTKNEPLYDALVLGIEIPRAELYARVDARVDDMFARGFVDEVRVLLKKYSADLPAFRTIGYREIMDVISSERSESRNLIRSGACARSAREAPLDSAPTSRGSARDDICNHTHAYARRQLTWLRRMKYVQWCKTPEEALTIIAKSGSLPT